VKIPYLGHIPFVLLFLAFAAIFVVTHWTTNRR
jgi:hypothetical protein